jgi:DNA phosphorothioation-associated putative methyltransferase
MPQETVGKRVLDELYIHLSAVRHLGDSQQVEAIAAAQAAVPAEHPYFPNVAKLNVRTGGLSLLCYRDFDSAPFPELQASWVVKATAPSPAFNLRLYTESLNPPVLHRKERLVGPDHPAREAWKAVTATAEALGLFDETRTIGFRLNWERLIAKSGYRLVGTEFLPIGNDTSELSDTEPEIPGEMGVLRHLTALTRSELSAPVQLLVRHGLIHPQTTFFDYGCGRKGDVTVLQSQGFSARGWDPHYWPEAERVAADVVNLGFVINVIEDPAERVDALRCAYQLTRRVLSVAVMLASRDSAGKPFGDGVLTSRRTFQKYFTQAELKDYVEQVLHEPAVMVAPGIAFVFADKDLEQQFLSGRFRAADMVQRLLRRSVEVRSTRRVQRLERRPRAESSPRRRENAQTRQLEAARPLLEDLWARALDLGRYPDPVEFHAASELLAHVGTWTRAIRLLRSTKDQGALEAARAFRRDDVALFIVQQLLSKRTPYRKLEPRLQHDIKEFFGDHTLATAYAKQLLETAANPESVLRACEQATELGLGWLDGQHSLQLHISLVNRLPAVLRAYIACGTTIWDQTSNVQLVKVHVGSGKLTLLEYDDFDISPVPLLRRRVKVGLRRLSCEVYEYGTEQFPQTVLIGKSRFLHEDLPGYEEQVRFDALLEQAGVGPSWTGTGEALEEYLAGQRLEVRGGQLCASSTIPALDAPCGATLTFRQLVECGETQMRLGVMNVPQQADSYNALHALAVNILDPVIEYFGGIDLTYGVCCSELGKHIKRSVAPRLDQHASHETNSKGKRICERDGASCDFIVQDEDMLEVAHWIRANLPFDRLYFYGKDRPIHVSYGPSRSGEAYEMYRTASGRLMPRKLA